MIHVTLGTLYHRRVKPQRGGPNSVSESNVPEVKQYIAKQEEHHKQMTFQDEFREICRRHAIEIDERYVWD